MNYEEFGMRVGVKNEMEEFGTNYEDFGKTLSLNEMEEFKMNYEEFGMKWNSLEGNGRV
jgi:hypothetical protein